MLLLFLAWAVYHQVFGREDLGDILTGFRSNFKPKNAPWILLAALLMPFNWSLETEKWRILLRPELELPFRRALAGILTGISVSLFTPNRIGEYGGRLLLIPAEKSWLGLAATLVGNMAQWVVLLLGGLWGATTVGPALFSWLAHIPQWYVWLMWWLAATLPILYIHMGRFTDWLKERKWQKLQQWSQWPKLERALIGYKKSKLIRVLGIALLRYLIYSSQYLFLLYGFGIEVSMMEGLAGITLIFLIQSSIPLPPFMALVARGELAILLWSAYGANELAVLASTFALFIINLLIPALLGGAAIVKIK